MNSAELPAVQADRDALIDLIGELGREVFYLLDDCETSGPVGEEVHTITTHGLERVSAILDKIDALPFEEPGVILGTGAMLQAAIKQTFATPPAACLTPEALAMAERIKVLEAALYEIGAMPPAGAFQCGGIARAALAKSNGEARQ